MFSIIVPSYNRNAEVNALLVSLTAQTRQNFEVIIVDDCSQNSVKIDRSFSFPVRVIRNQENKGPAESRNVGAQHALNDWLLFLDDDDRFENEKCRVLTERIERNPQANFIYHPAKCVMVNEGFTYYTKPYTDVSQLTMENILHANKIGGMPMLAIRKELFIDVGGLSDRLKALEDYDFVLKVIKNPNFAPLFVNEPLTVCFFRTGVASVSKNIANTERALKYIETTYANTPQQRKNLRQNGFAVLAYPHLMSLSRKSAWFYFKQATTDGLNIKTLMVACIALISPKLAVNLKRFI